MEQLKHNKTKRITIRLEVNEANFLFDKARAAGICPSSYVRQSVLNKQIRYRITPEQLEIFKNLVKMSSNLNQIVKAVHIHGPFSLLPTIVATLNDLNSVISKLK